MKGKKGAGKPRKGMLGDLKEAFSQKKGQESNPENIQNKTKREESDGYVEMRTMAMTERGEGIACQEPARGWKTNDDDDDTNIVLCSCHTDKNTKQHGSYL